MSGIFRKPNIKKNIKKIILAVFKLFYIISLFLACSQFKSSCADRTSCPYRVHDFSFSRLSKRKTLSVLFTVKKMQDFLPLICFKIY